MNVRELFEKLSSVEDWDREVFIESAGPLKETCLDDTGDQFLLFGDEDA